MTNALFLPQDPSTGLDAGEEGMRLLAQIEELRAGVAMLAACLEAAVDGRPEGPGNSFSASAEKEAPRPDGDAGAEFLRAYA
jgi:hypothetical protein